MKFAYHNRGTFPSSRAADAVALGSLGGAHTLAKPTLPAPGAPEVMAGMGGCGCGCKGTGSCGMGAITDLFQQSNWPYLAAAGVAAYFLLKKKRRR